MRGEDDGEKWGVAPAASRLLLISDSTIRAYVDGKVLVA